MKTSKKTTHTKTDGKKAVIYCRVSSERQVREGDGLNSQEKSCREYAERENFQVKKVFKDEGVSGMYGPDQRPAFLELLQFLDTQKDKYIIIVDQLDRLTRDHKAKIEIMAHVITRGAEIKSPNHNFGNTPDEEFQTDIMVSVAAYQRKANRQQVINRQNSRLLNGYWTFKEPIGYKYVEDVAGGKIMVRNEPDASLIVEALEGYAAGRFSTQRDILRFLNGRGGFKKSKKVHADSVKNMLSQILYTGMIEYPKWNISLRQGKHPPLISLQTYRKIQDRLAGKAKAPYRKDLNKEFPLRGFILCSSCNEPLTASWCKGRTKKYPYYHCKTKGCEKHSKGINRDNAETDFEEILKTMAPSDAVLKLTEAIVKDCWKDKKSQLAHNLSELDSAVKNLDIKINGFMDRLLETHDKEIIRRYEDHIKKLSKERDFLSAQASQAYMVDSSFEGAVGTVFDFISNPHSLWANGDLEDKRLVMKLAFAKRLPYSKDDGFGTVSKSLPFTVLGNLDAHKGKMVEEAGFEPT